MTEPRVYIRYQWECSCCHAKGELRFPPEGTCNEPARKVEDDHRHVSPQCGKLRYYIARLEDEYVYPETLL